MIKRYLKLSLFLLLLVIQARGQLFLNGSFETNMADFCEINISNNAFTNIMNASFAFGEKNEVDILSESCGFGAALEGDFFIALNSQNTVDAISIELAELLESGKQYTFSYFEKSGASINSLNGIQIGVSEIPDEFGILVYSSTTLSENWKENVVQFVAPQDAKYITLKANENFNSWVFVDNFKKQCPVNLSIGNDSILCEVNNLKIGLEDIYDNYLWSDNSGSPEIIINSPGLYWVEVEINNCILRDSISILEYPNNCNCEVFVPNAFSPNNDGKNDLFQVFPQCELATFKLNIYNRWGTLIYTSNNPGEGWDGRLSNGLKVSDVYLFQIYYQLPFEIETKRKQGYLTLIK